MATAIADHRAGAAPADGAPSTADGDRRWRAQSLAHGAAGVALFHIERAHAGLGAWPTSHRWLSVATAGDLSAGDNAGLFFGVPAVAFACHAAAGGRTGRYQQALRSLDAGVATLTRYRLHQAHQRIAQGRRPALAEYDLILGLTGLGAYLLRRQPHGALLREVLAYLVRLTQPLPGHDTGWPGWWTDLDPAGRRSPRYPGGHGNLGMAHGIGGPLALLSLAMRHGVIVDGQTEAIGRICDWLDVWRQDHDHGPWWPEWVTPSEVDRQRLRRPGPGRPSWCYGTPGLARAQQLAGLATGDTARQHLAETALLGCLTNPHQSAQIPDTSLCHGTAGLLQTAWRIAAEAQTTDIAARLPGLLDRLVNHRLPSADIGFLEGTAGLALALHTIAADAAPLSGWDACLLLT
ncbi:MAG: lanthionine synthetase C family protein [Dactylosporangium sp.]|nr:lanthionine synthetase C family protein [Dactylosporangium sp.]NNJ61918.1 lanthionine synthetase C family protein [Dactylosporangium sp.]